MKEGTLSMPVQKISRDSIGSNVYLRNMKQSFLWLKELKEESLHLKGKAFPKIAWEKMFGTKRGNIVSEKELNLYNGKTAIILMGLSGCGKSTFARAFKRDNPSFELCIFDEVELGIMAHCANERMFLSEEVADEMAIYAFGQLLEECGKANKNIVVDGQFVYCNARGALLKTLRYYGYDNIIIFNFLTRSNEFVKACLSNRAIEQAYMSLVQQYKQPEEFLRTGLRILGRDCRELVETIMPIEEWKKTLQYKSAYAELYYHHFEIEPVESDVKFQTYCGCFNYGIESMFYIK